MKKIGLITYHSAYNFGSVLQAKATEYIIDKYFGKCTIINYRMKSQKDYYSIFTINYGVKTAVKDALRLPYYKQLKSRKNKFESFFLEYFNLTQEFENPNDINNIYNNFDIIVSGSDQIWNRNSCELYGMPIKYMLPYLLEGYSGKKISYASSIGSMNDDQIAEIIPYLKKFDSISMREHYAADKISKLLGHNVKTVLDPTLLVDANQWKETFNVSNNNIKDRYILFYFLGPLKDANFYISNIENVAKNNNLKVKIITPFIKPKYNNDISEFSFDYGPIDFINLINNAEFIVTDSYHGTLFSINFHKEFACICKGIATDLRKTDILNTLKLNRALFYKGDDLSARYHFKLDYSYSDGKILSLRNASIKYLTDNIED